jgi:hypothetical protein
MTDPSPPTILQRILEFNRIETDLAEAEIQRIIDEANAEVVRRWGPHANPLLTIPGGSPTFHLARPLDATQTIVIVESWRSSFSGGVTETTLDETDYKVWFGGRIIERLFTGLNPGFRFTHERDLFAWGGPAGWVDITYTPTNDGNQREEVIIKLVKLSIDYESATRIDLGDVRVFEKNYLDEREALLNSLRPPGVLLR